MRLLVSLFTLVYVAIVFAFVGAVAGFFLGFMSVLWLGADFSCLPLFGAGGAVACSVWGFSRVFLGDARATFAEAAPRDDNWVAGHPVHDTRVAADDMAPSDALILMDSLDPPNHVDQPRWMIDAFTFGDNLYEAVYEA